MMMGNLLKSLLVHYMAQLLPKGRFSGSEKHRHSHGSDEIYCDCFTDLAIGIEREVSVSRCKRV